MKKLLKVSLMAMLVAAPFAANAAGEPMDANVAPYAGVDATAVADVASTSYVKGAYNDVIGKINKVATTAAAGQTAQQVEDAIDGAAGAGIATDGSGKLSVDLTSNGGLEFAGDGDAQTVGVKVDGTHVVKDSTSGAVTLSATDIAALGKADTALQKADVTTGSAAGTISVGGTDVAVNGVLTDASAFATAAQGAKADTALQKADVTTGSAAGTISVGGADVAVNGVLTDATAFATAAQGAKADTALQQTDISSTYSSTGTAAVNGTAVAAALAGQRVTVHTVWNTDTVAQANVLTAAQ